MNKQQKKNLLNHAAFMEKVITHKSNGLNMAVYYSTAPEDVAEGYYKNTYPDDINFDEQDLTPLEEGNGPCGFCACVIGWAAHNPDLPKPDAGEGWEEYASRVFGCNNWDAGAYAFHAGLNIEQGKDAANRIREMVAAYPTALKISKEDWNPEYYEYSYENYSYDYDTSNLYRKFN